MAALVQVADSVTVDDHGLTLPASVGGVVTVAFDGRYVWSFQPGRDARPGASRTGGALAGVAAAAPERAHPADPGRARDRPRRTSTVRSCSATGRRQGSGSRTAMGTRSPSTRSAT